MDESTNNPINYDEVTIEQEAAHLPESMREDYRWLKVFAREECGRAVLRLTERFQSVGVMHDSTTWSKIMRGRWNRNPHGDPLPSPVISQEKFQAAVERLRADVRAGAMRGRVPYTETSSGLSMFGYMDRLVASDRINKFGVIVGPTGSQKTATFREFERRRNHASTHWIECPENGSLSDLLAMLAARFGYRRNAINRAKSTLLTCVKSHHLLILDNAQDLWKPGSLTQPAFSFLRRLQDVTGCTIVLSITNTFEQQLLDGLIRGYFEQFEGRSGGRNKWLRLPEYAPEDDVLAIAQAFGLQDARKHLKALVAISREPGRIRRLFEDLQEAKILANAEKAKLTMDHVRTARGED